VNVPVHFQNQEAAPGIKRGGSLNIVLHTIELVVPADNIPEAIAADLTGLDFNDALHIGAIKLPEGVDAVDKTNFTIATISPPTGGAAGAAEDAAAAAAAAAPATGKAAPKAAAAKPAPAKK
jgi:large subunit ribosomal protein L25